MSIEIENIKNKLDIVNVISEYVSGISKAGSNYKCLCPFHNEKTPSFMINPDLQIFKCFGCGIGGDVIKFIQEYEKISFPEALKIAAEKAGITLSSYSTSQDKFIKEEKEKIIEANTLTAKFYNYILTKDKYGKLGMHYAKKREINDEIINKFQIGYAPESKNNLKNFLNKKGFKDEDLIRWGLLVNRDGKVIDKFRNRLIQPIFNTKGLIVGFSGRYIGQSKNPPKYLNSPETVVFKKNEILYGIYHAKEAMRKTNFVIVEEGNIDVLSSHRVGVENIVAPLGTSFTLNQALLVKKFVSTVYFAFDTDEAGINALIRSIKIVEEAGLNHKVIDIRGYKDPDDLIIQSPNMWLKKITEPVDSIDYLINLFLENNDLSKLDAKNKFANYIIPVMSYIKNEITFNHYVRVISSILQIKEDVLINKYIRKTDKNNTVISSVENSSKQTEPNKKNNFINEIKSNQFKKELYFLSLLYQSKKAYTHKFKPEIFESEINKEIFLKMENIILKKMDIYQLNNELSELAQSIIQEIVLTDLSLIQDIEIEKQKVYNSLYRDYIKRQIEYLTDMDDDESIKKVNELVKELKIYT